MPKQSPVPDELDQPFYDALNEDRLLIQYCKTDDRFQYPPASACGQCGKAENLEWRQVEGNGHIYSYGVIYDSPIASLQADQPYNCAVISLDEAPGVNFMSHLPGTPPDEVPMDAPVKLVFQVTPGNGQKVPEWEVVK
jgi:hypothetical protein